MVNRNDAKKATNIQRNSHDMTAGKSLFLGRLGNTLSSKMSNRKKAIEKNASIDHDAGFVGCNATAYAEHKENIINTVMAIRITSLPADPFSLAVKICELFFRTMNSKSALCL